MQVVINACFGGFGLSLKALYALIKKKSDAVTTMDVSEFFGKRDWEEELKSVWSHSGLPRYVKYKDNLYMDGYSGSFLVDKVAKKVYYCDRHEHEFRRHPDVIAIVKKLGKKSWGKCAELKIVDIPDGTDFTIEEYDGNEHIAEAHETWS